MLLLYESKLCTATIIFYTCIYIPFIQIKQLLCSMLGFILCLHDHHPPEHSGEQSTAVDLVEEACSIDLPMSRYGDLKNSSCCNDMGDRVINAAECEEACSVCLVEFENEDLVSQLSKCGHVFHMVCIEKWVEKNQFTCPLCRSSFLNLHESKCHETCNAMLSCFSS